MIMAIKAFIITQAAFQYGAPIFDFDIEKCHFQLIERLNTALLPFGIKPKDVPVDFSICVFALIAAIIEFSIAKIQIKFGYFFYVQSSLPELTEEEEDFPSATSRT